MTPIEGLGPHGERAASLAGLVVTEDDADLARARRFTVAIVLHTATSDWSRRQLAGIVTTLGLYGAAAVEVVDCGFSYETQIRALGRLARQRIDAIVSLPVGNENVGQAHAAVARSGKVLVLLDNAPTGLLPGRDYMSLVSADSFGLGRIGAKLLAPHVPHEGTVGILAHGVDFFVTNEREIAFRKWLSAERPDIAIKRAKFHHVDQVAPVLGALLDATPDLDGLFAVWDEPAMRAVAALGERRLPMTTIDLGHDAAVALAEGAILKGIGAQQPHDQGVAAARATILALAGRQPPAWIALPGLEVTAANVVESYQVVWHAPAPPDLIRAAGRG